MAITKQQNGADLTVPPFYVRDDGVKISESEIVQSTRIGVDYADDWKQRPWRFFLKDNIFVSRKK
jgi:DNA-3-methyladenine glycosylase